MKKGVWFLWEITPRCNLNCRFCYNLWRGSYDYSVNRVLGFKEIVALWEKTERELSIKEIKTEGITLTGGEPLLCSFLPSLISYFRQKKIPVHLISNGVLLSEGMAEKLAEADLTSLEISLPSVHRKTYRELTGSDVLTLVKKNIISFKSICASIPLTLSTTVMNENIHETEDFLSLVWSLMAKRGVINPCVPHGRSQKTDRLLSLEEYRGLLTLCDVFSREYHFPVDISTPGYNCEIRYSDYPHLNFASCVCGEYKWLIDFKGDLRLCEQSPVIAGSLFHNSVTDLMENKKAGLFRSLTISKECVACSEFNRCRGGCRYVPVAV